MRSFIRRNGIEYARRLGWKFGVPAIAVAKKKSRTEVLRPALLLEFERRGFRG